MLHEEADDTNITEGRATELSEKSNEVVDSKIPSVIYDEGKENEQRQGLEKLFSRNRYLRVRLKRKEKGTVESEESVSDFLAESPSKL